LAAKVRHDNRVHLIAPLPSLIHCSAVPRWLPDRVIDALCFEKLVHLGFGEGRVASEIKTLHGSPVACDHRFQHLAPAVGAVHVTRPQGAPLDIAELVEHEQRVVAGAAEIFRGR
jgi:hypothetical protein